MQLTGLICILLQLTGLYLYLFAACSALSVSCCSLEGFICILLLLTGLYLYLLLLQDNEETRLWRYALYAHIERQQLEEADEALQRYTANAGLLDEVFSLKHLQPQSSDVSAGGSCAHVNATLSKAMDIREHIDNEGAPAAANDDDDVPGAILASAQAAVLELFHKRHAGIDLLRQALSMFAANHADLVVLASGDAGSEQEAQRHSMADINQGQDNHGTEWDGDAVVATTTEQQQLNHGSHAVGDGVGEAVEPAGRKVVKEDQEQQLPGGIGSICNDDGQQQQQQQQTAEGSGTAIAGAGSDAQGDNSAGYYKQPAAICGISSMSAGLVLPFGIGADASSRFCRRIKPDGGWQQHPHYLDATRNSMRL